jgi:hypothetical protein
MGMGGVNGVYNVLKVTKWKEKKHQKEQKLYIVAKELTFFNLEAMVNFCIKNYL